MRQAQAIVYETDGRLAGQLRERATAGRWLVREVRHLAACRSHAQDGGSVVVLKLGRDLERELALVAELTLLTPDLPVVVVGDVDNSALAGLAWDLGASFVLFPPLPRELLPEIVTGLLERGREESDAVRTAAT